MTCSHCCGAEKIFDIKEAQKMLKRYRKKGPAKTTKRLLEAIGKENLDGKTLLDIGGGVGALQQGLLAIDLEATTGVDASLSYINAAKELGEEKQSKDRMTFVHADFLDVHQELNNHDLVTLEKVVCCYPNVQDLIKESARKSTDIYGLVYPSDNFLSRLIVNFGNLYLRFSKNPFRSFVHSERMMNSLIINNGFERIHYSTVFPWKIAVYKRI